MTSILDQLKQQSRDLHTSRGLDPDSSLREYTEDDYQNDQAQAEAESGHTPEAAAADEVGSDEDEKPQPVIQPNSRDGPMSDNNQQQAAYLSYWTAVIDKASKVPIAEAGAGVRAALQGAPSDIKPDASDKKLFQIAGCGALPYREVAAGLRMRQALNENGQQLNNTQIQFWANNPVIVRAPLEPNGKWKGIIEGVNASTTSATKLTDAQLSLFTKQPRWATAYVKCALQKAQFEQASQQTDTKAMAAPAISGALGNDTKPDPSKQGLPVTGYPQTVQQVGGHPRSIPQHTAQSSVGDALGKLLFAPIGIAANIGQSFYRQGKISLLDLRQQHVTQHLPDESDQALREFEQSMDTLHANPKFTPIWKRAEADAEQKQSSVAALLKDGRLDPALKQTFAEQLKNDPVLSQHVDRAYTAFDKVCDLWKRTTHAHSHLNMQWEPSKAQQERLQAAANKMLPDGRFNDVMAQQADNLLKSLREFITRLIDRLAAKSQVGMAAKPSSPATTSPSM